MPQIRTSFTRGGWKLGILGSCGRLWSHAFRDTCLRLAICMLAIFLRWPCFFGNFVFDDERTIVRNTLVHARSPPWGILTKDYWGTPLTSSFSHGSFRPLTSAMFWSINAAFHASERSHVGEASHDVAPPVAFHAVSFAFHAINTWLVHRVAMLLVCVCVHMAVARVRGLSRSSVRVCVARRSQARVYGAGHRESQNAAPMEILVDSSGRPVVDASADEYPLRAAVLRVVHACATPSAHVLGHMAALLFALHPLNTEAVCNISSLGDVLACTFTLLGARAALSLMIRSMGTFQALNAMEDIVAEENVSTALQSYVGVAEYASRYSSVMTVIVSTVVATAAKETGLMTAPLAWVWMASAHVWLVLAELPALPETPSVWLRASWAHIVSRSQGLLAAVRTAPTQLTRFVPLSIILLPATTIVLFTLRLILQGWRVPYFDALENPIVGLHGMQAVFTTAVLWMRHASLLMFPYPLAPDWSYLSIPPVMSPLDFRVLTLMAALAAGALISAFGAWVFSTGTVASQAVLTTLQVTSVSSGPTASISARNKGPVIDTSAAATVHVFVIMACAFLTVPAVMVLMLPSSNVFFLVGFTVAERIMYPLIALTCPLLALALNSMYHIVMAVQAQPLSQPARKPMTIKALALLLCASVAVSGFLQSRVWQSSLELWSHTKFVNPSSGKAWAAYGLALMQHNRSVEAGLALSHAIGVHPKTSRFAQISVADARPVDATVDLVHLHLHHANNPRTALRVLDEFFEDVVFERKCQSSANFTQVHAPCNYNDQAERLGADFTLNHDRLEMYAMLAVNWAVVRATDHPNPKLRMPLALEALDRASSTVELLPAHRRKPLYPLLLADRWNRVQRHQYAAKWYWLHALWLLQSEPDHEASRLLQGAIATVHVNMSHNTATSCLMPRVGASAELTTRQQLRTAPTMSLASVSQAAAAAYHKQSKCTAALAAQSEDHAVLQVELVRLAQLRGITPHVPACSCASMTECPGTPCAAMHAIMNAAAATTNYLTLFSDTSGLPADALGHFCFYNAAVPAGDPPERRDAGAAIMLDTLLPSRIVAPAGTSTLHSRQALSDLLKLLHVSQLLQGVMGNDATAAYIAEIARAVRAGVCRD